jgi:hypothetical protein
MARMSWWRLPFSSARIATVQGFQTSPVGNVAAAWQGPQNGTGDLWRA